MKKEEAKQIAFDAVTKETIKEALNQEITFTLPLFLAVHLCQHLKGSQDSTLQYIATFLANNI